jgi:hypothetical protein
MRTREKMEKSSTMVAAEAGMEAVDKTPAAKVIKANLRMLPPYGKNSIE